VKFFSIYRDIENFMFTYPDDRNKLPVYFSTRKAFHYIVINSKYWPTIYHFLICLHIPATRPSFYCYKPRITNISRHITKNTNLIISKMHGKKYVLAHKSKFSKKSNVHKYTSIFHGFHFFKLPLSERDSSVTSTSSIFLGNRPTATA